MMKPPLPEGLRRVEVPASVAAKLDMKLAVAQSAQHDFAVACDIALSYAGETTDAGIVGIENGPDVFAVIVRDEPALPPALPPASSAPGPPST